MNGLSMSNKQAGYATEAPAPMHPVPGSLNALAIAVNELDSAAAMLRDRLNSALLPAMPQQTGSNAGVHAVETKSMLASEIDGQRRRVDAVRELLEDVLNRLEV